MRKYIYLCTLALIAVSCSKENTDTRSNEFARPATSDSSPYISKIIEYRPAPGQFTNTLQGNDKAANSIIGCFDGNVSLGGWGGYIAFSFDHTVENIDGVDFAIRGNSFSNSSEPGVVMVSEDTNRNGIADDVWYTLKGTLLDGATLITDYEVTYKRPIDLQNGVDIEWTDNKGGKGVISSLEYNKQSMFPTWSSGDITIKGWRLPNNSVWSDSKNVYILSPVGSGWADNYSSEYEQGADAKHPKCNTFDIDKAVDINLNAVKLKGIDFIKVYTGVNQSSGWIGECSTEILGAVSFSIGK